MNGWRAEEAHFLALTNQLRSSVARTTGHATWFYIIIVLSASAIAVTSYSSLSVFRSGSAEKKRVLDYSALLEH